MNSRIDHYKINIEKYNVDRRHIKIYIPSYNFTTLHYNNIHTLFMEQLDNEQNAFWRKDWENIEDTLVSTRDSLINFPSFPLRIMRVSQLDADILDSELFDMLKEQLWQIFSLFKVTFLLIHLFIYTMNEIHSLSPLYYI